MERKGYKVGQGGTAPCSK